MHASFTIWYTTTVLQKQLIFTTNDNIYSHNTCTRSSSNIYINCNKTNYGKFSLKYQGAEVWNNLPADLVKEIKFI